MKRSLKISIGFALLLGLLASIATGCASNPRLRPTDASVSLGGSIKGAWGHTESAIYDFDEVGKEKLSDRAKAFWDAGKRELSRVLVDLTEASASQRRTNSEYASAIARNNLLEGDNRAIRSSWPYRIGRFIVWAFVLIVAWIFVAWTFPVLGLILPGWWGWLIGGIGRIANPTGWGQWYAEKQRIKSALYAQPPTT